MVDTPHVQGVGARERAEIHKPYAARSAPLIENLRGSALHRTVPAQLVGMARGQHCSQLLNQHLRAHHVQVCEQAGSQSRLWRYILVNPELAAGCAYASGSVTPKSWCGPGADTASAVWL